MGYPLDWDLKFLEALRSSRPAWDEKPDWRAALALYDGLSPQDVAALDRTVIAMIDEDYRNPHSAMDNVGFDDVMVNLPAGMTPDDLMCVEAASLVAAERGISQAFFAVGRLLRSPRWHALNPRLMWLSYHVMDVQRKLGLTRAGRSVGALLGAAVADGLAPGADGVTAGPRGDRTGALLHVACALAESPQAPEAAVQTLVVELADDIGPGWLLLGAVASALAAGRDTTTSLALVRLVDLRPDARSAVTAFQTVLAAALDGAGKSEAMAAGLAAVPELRARLAGVGRLAAADLAPGGDLVDVLEAVLWHFQTTESFKACLAGSMLHPDVRSACGALVGAFYGPGAVPRRWSTAVRDRGVLEDTAQRLYTLWDGAAH